jgi:hypothetical protein
MTDKQQEIFNYFTENHGLTLTVSEMDDIREVCLTQEEKTASEMRDALIESVKNGIALAKMLNDELPECWKEDKRVTAIEKATGLPIEEVLND